VVSKTESLPCLQGVHNLLGRVVCFFIGVLYTVYV
jgi:hypothetical protein